MFLVNSNELERRLDPHFYKPIFRKIVRNLGSAESERLGNIARFSDESWDQKRFFETTFPYIEIGEIDLASGEIRKISDLRVEEAPSRAKMIVRRGDILVSKTRPNRGAISFMDNEGIFVASTGFSVIREMKNRDVDKRYLFHCLRLDQSLRQMEQRSSGGNYPAITEEELGEIKIPVPPRETQSRIVSNMDDAYAVRKQKEAEAERLLAGIDDYLLGELGIEPPEPEENTPQSRIFITNFHSLMGGRWDPAMARYSRFVTESKYEISSLGRILTNNPQYGANEAGVTRSDVRTPRYIRVTDIDSYGNLISGLGVTANTIEDKYILKNNDLLIARSGTVGKSYLHKADLVDFPCLYAGYMIRFTLDTQKALPDYVFYYLQSKPYKAWVKAVQRTTAQPNINAQEYKSLLLPLPPLEKQTEIADRIAEMRDHAERLRREADAELERAKREAEAIIFGGRKK